MTQPKPKGSGDHTNSDLDNEKEWKNFEDFSKAIFSVKPEEITELRKKEKKKKRKTRHK